MAEFNFTPLATPIDSQTPADAGIADKSRFLPTIPQAKLDTSLPQGLLDQITAVQKAGVVTRSKERDRLDREAKALLEANKEINAAENQIQKISESAMLEFVGIFDSDYSYQHQEGKIRAAKRKLNTVGLETELERKRDELALKDANVPLEMYKQLLKLGKEKFEYTTAQANMVIQSNAAQSSQLKILQDLVPYEDIKKAVKTGQYTDVITPEFARKIINEQRSSDIAFENASISAASGRLKLKDENIVMGLRLMPVQEKWRLLQEAGKNKNSLIKLPNGITIAAEEMRKSLSGQMTEKQDAFMSIAKTNLEIAKNAGDVSATLAGVQNVSAGLITPTMNPDGTISQLDMQGINILNTTPEMIEKFNFNQVHPHVRAETFQYLQTMANITYKRDNGELITRDDQSLMKAAQDKLNAAVQTTQASILEATPKEAKAAQKEWFTNNRMQSGDNAAAMLVTNVFSSQNFNGDMALESAYQIFAENIADKITGNKLDWAKLEPAERTNLMMQSLIENNFKGNPKARELAIEAIHTPNKAGITPFDAYVNHKSAYVVKTAVDNLMAKRPELKPYLMPILKQIGYSNHQKLAIILANVSFQSQLKNPDLPDNVLNMEMKDEMEEILAKEGKTWGQQMNPVRGSLIISLFKQAPNVLIDTALGSSYGSEAGSAWLKLQQTTQPPAAQPERPSEPDVFGRDEFDIEQSQRILDKQREKYDAFDLGPNVPVVAPK